MSDSPATALDPAFTTTIAASREPQNSDAFAIDPAALRELLDHLPDGVIHLNRDWQIVYANIEGRRLSRLTDAQLSGPTHWQLYPETVNTGVEITYRQVMETRLPSHIEHFYAPFGLWLDIHVHPIAGGIALYYRDVTARKHAEAARDASARQLNQVLEAADDSIVCIDRDWNCTFANHAAHHLLKTNRLIGENLWTRFPSNQQDPYASNYRAAMEQRISTEFEAYYPEPLNIWFRVLARPYDDGIIIFSNDITPRKNAEALRDSTARRLNQVFEATTDAIASLDRQWNFTFLNGNARRILAVSGELLGKNVWQQFPAAVESEFQSNFQRTMAERIPTEFDAFYPAPLNRWFSVQARPSDDGIVVFFRDITAERAARQYLIDQQAVLTFVQETAGVATWEIDLATNAMTFGGGSYPVFGHPLTSIKTVDDYYRIVHPDHLQAVQNATRHALESGNVITVDYKVTAADGRLLWIERRALPVYDNSGKPTHLRGMSIDITGRKQNEEQLAASEERYRVLADLNPQAIWMGAPDGRITYANQRFIDYTGPLPDHTPDHTGWLAAFYPQDRQNVREAWFHSISHGIDFEIEARMIRARDGAARWWWLRALPVRDESGNILHWLGVCIDIHDAKTHAEALHQRQLETERQRTELETIYQTAPIGLALFEPKEFRYLRVNERQAETLGLPKEQIIGRRITELAPLKGLVEIFRQVAAGHSIRNHLLEGELPTRPGEHRFWNVSYSPVHAPDGSVEAIAAVIQEITHQKKAEEALIQSEKLAAVGRLASSISHEINNPLEAITNLLYLVALDENLPEDLRPYISMAQSELSRVCQIATQTLRFHRQAVRATHVSAKDLVNAVLNLYQGRLSNSGINVEAQYDTSTKILCFENDIRQVLNNLIANAIDAMRNGGRLLARAHNATIRTQHHPEGVRGVRITIADTGHGMDPEVQRRLFEPFYTTKDLNGTGLGLWISAGIVARHNGRLTFRSSTHPISHGTVFSLFLPLEDDPVHPA